MWPFKKKSQKIKNFKVTWCIYKSMGVYPYFKTHTQHNTFTEKQEMDNFIETGQRYGLRFKKYKVTPKICEEEIEIT